MNLKLFSLLLVVATGCDSSPVSDNSPDTGPSGSDVPTPSDQSFGVDIGIDTSNSTSVDGSMRDEPIGPQTPEVVLDQGTSLIDRPTEGGVSVDVGSLDGGRGDAADAVQLDTSDVGAFVDASLDDVQSALDVVQDVPADRGTGGDVLDASLDVPSADVPPGSIYCGDPGAGGRWVNANHDPQNCGGCGRRCCGNFCINARCTSDGPPGSLSCPLTPEEEEMRGCYGRVTVDGRFDVNNCGGCRIRCAMGQICFEGTCLNR